MTSLAPGVRGICPLLRGGQHAHAGSPSKYLGFSAPGSQLPLSCASAFTLMQTREPLLLNGVGSCGRAATPLTKEDFSMVAFMAAVPASWDCLLAPAALDGIALHAIRLRFGRGHFKGFDPSGYRASLLMEGGFETRDEDSARLRSEGCTIATILPNERRQ